ncbi:uncharacterized protein RHOBADRAFT_45377 [Rhodotorula graminis WP1]|uniref:Uncharacterized protein n=1 Tax=Rhodotorula graminis (strain WP1) TaxID=578459 RepID=A0A0P9F2P8_RHOGW|nr:uncharacterized protein RHOBADRAFT_45377 [Rhodotorula graminis WP1]KPV74081.1 hypothetical protein RHOBADRAFT_45377 [Rhodotorula graminis WP1]
MHDAAHLLACLSLIFEWLEEASSGPQAEHDRQSLQNSRAKFEEVWPDYLPTEREEVVEQLLIRLCRSYCMGFVNTNTSAYSHINSLVQAGHAPSDSLSPRASANAALKIKLEVTKIVVVFYAKVDEPVTNGERAARAIKWAAGLVGPSGITAAKLARLGQAGALIVTGMLAEIARRAEAAGRQHASLPNVEVPLPSADGLIKQAQMRTQLASSRFDHYVRLLRATGLLYSVDNGSNMTAAADKLTESTFMSSHVRLVETADLDFARVLKPEQRQRVVDHARDVVYQVCADFHDACRTFLRDCPQALVSGRPLPPAPTLPAAETVLSNLTRPFYIPHAFEPPSRPPSVRRPLAPAPRLNSHQPKHRAAHRVRHPHVWRPYSLAHSSLQDGADGRATGWASREPFLA